MQSSEERSTSGSGNAGAAAAASPTRELLYHETKWIVLNLLSCAPSAAGSPTASSRPFKMGHGSQSPRTLAAGVSLRLVGNLDGKELDVDGDAAEDFVMDTTDGASKSSNRRRPRASLTLDVRPIAGSADAAELSAQEELQHVIEEEASAELSRLTEELRRVDVDVSASPLLTPQTEVANILRVLGDKMNAHFTPRLELVAEDVVDARRPASDGGSGGDPPLAYDDFARGARRLISGSPEIPAASGWNAVTLVLAYANRVTWNLWKRGHRSLGDVADYTTRVLWDNAADFIVQQGGWTMSPIASLMQSSSSSSSAPTPSSGDSVDGAASPQSPVRGTSIQQAGGYIHTTRDQRDGTRNGCSADAARFRKISPDGNASSEEMPLPSLHNTGSSRCSSAAATLSSEMSLPMFSRTGSFDDDMLPLSDARELMPATSSADLGSHRSQSAAGSDAAEALAKGTGSVASDVLCHQYARALQDVQSDDDVDQSSTSSSPVVTCRTAIASHSSGRPMPRPAPRTPPRPLSSSLPRLAPSPFGSVRDVRLSSSFDDDGDELISGLRLQLGELSPSAFGSVRDLRTNTSSVSEHTVLPEGAMHADLAAQPAVAAASGVVRESAGAHAAKRRLLPPLAHPDDVRSRSVFATLPFVARDSSVCSEPTVTLAGSTAIAAATSPTERQCAVARERGAHADRSVAVSSRQWASLPRMARSDLSAAAAIVSSASPSSLTSPRRSQNCDSTVIAADAPTAPVGDHSWPLADSRELKLSLESAASGVVQTASESKEQSGCSCGQTDHEPCASLPVVSSQSESSRDAGVSPSSSGTFIEHRIANSSSLAPEFGLPHEHGRHALAQPPVGSFHGTAMASGRVRRSMDVLLSDLPLQHKREGDVAIAADAAATVCASSLHYPSSSSSWHPPPLQQPLQPRSISADWSHATNTEERSPLACQSVPDYNDGSHRKQTTLSLPLLSPAAIATQSAAAVTAAGVCSSASAAAAEGFDEPGVSVSAQRYIGRRNLYWSANRISSESPAQCRTGAFAESDAPSSVARAVGDSAVRLAAAAAVAVAAVAVSSAPRQRSFALIRDEDSDRRLIGQPGMAVAAGGSCVTLAGTEPSQSDRFTEVDGCSVAAVQPAGAATIADSNALARVQCACGCPMLRNAVAIDSVMPPCSLSRAEELPPALISHATAAEAAIAGTTPAAFATYQAGDACSTCTCSWLPAEVALDEIKPTASLPDHTGDGRASDGDDLIPGRSSCSDSGGSSGRDRLGELSDGCPISSVSSIVASDDLAAWRVRTQNQASCHSDPQAVDEQLAPTSVCPTSDGTAADLGCSLLPAAYGEADKDEVCCPFGATEAVAACCSGTTAVPAAASVPESSLVTSVPFSCDDVSSTLSKTTDSTVSDCTCRAVVVTASTGGVFLAADGEFVTELCDSPARNEQAAAAVASGAAVEARVETVDWLDAVPAGISSNIGGESEMSSSDWPWVMDKPSSGLPTETVATTKSQGDAFGLRLPDPVATVPDKVTLLQTPVSIDERFMVATSVEMLATACRTAPVAGDSLGSPSSCGVEVPQGKRQRKQQYLSRPLTQRPSFPSAAVESQDRRLTAEFDTSAPLPACAASLPAASGPDNASIAGTASKFRGDLCAAAVPTALDIGAAGRLRDANSTSAAEATAERSPQHRDALLTSSAASSVAVAAASENTDAVSTVSPAKSQRCRERPAEPQLAEPAASSRWPVIVGGVVVVVAIACATLFGRNRLLRG